MRLRKLGVSFLLILVLYAHAMMLGWLAMSRDDRTLPILSLSLELATTLYLLVLSVRSVFNVDFEDHWEFLIHVCSLVTTFTFLTSIRLLLPTSLPITSVRFSALGAATDSRIFQACDYFVFALYLSITLVTGTTPRSPKLHFPPSLVYSSKVLELPIPFPEENVCGIVHSSIFSFAFFDYITPIVLTGYRKGSLNVQDLPIPPARARATRLFNRMSEAQKTFKLTGRWKSDPGSGWELMLRLLKLNAKPYVIQTILAAISACLYYAPAFFLKNLVHFLEINHSKAKVDRSWG